MRVVLCSCAVQCGGICRSRPQEAGAVCYNNASNTPRLLRQKIHI